MPAGTLAGGAERLTRGDTCVHEGTGVGVGLGGAVGGGVGGAVGGAVGDGVGVGVGGGVPPIVTETEASVAETELTVIDHAQRPSRSRSARPSGPGRRTSRSAVMSSRSLLLPSEGEARWTTTPLVMLALPTRPASKPDAPAKLEVEIGAGRCPGDLQSLGSASDRLHGSDRVGAARGDGRHRRRGAVVQPAQPLLLVGVEVVGGVAHVVERVAVFVDGAAVPSGTEPQSSEWEW